MDNLKRLYSNNSSTILTYGFAFFLLITFSLFVPGFGSNSHVDSMLKDAAILGILALGQTLVILIGGLDLSLPCTMTVSGMLATLLLPGFGINLSFPVMVIICLALAALLGLINGIGIAYLDINPIIMTFGINTIVIGALTGTIGNGISVGYALETMRTAVNSQILGISAILIFWIIITILTGIILRLSSFGRKIYAIGNSEKVAYYSGIEVRFVKMLVYAISGLCGGIAGLLFTGRYGQAYLGMGSQALFYPITAAAIGGISMIGGKGNYYGTVAGSFILILVGDFIQELSLGSGLNSILYGFMLVAAIFISYLNNKK